MSSSLNLNAQATIIQGHGLGVSQNLYNIVTTYQNLPTIKLYANIAQIIAATSGQTQTNLNAPLSSIVSNVAAFMFDVYPAWATPVSSGNVQYYGNVATPVYTQVGEQEVLTGYTYSGLANTASFSQTLETQANLAFINNYKGFANVYSYVSGAATSSFETVSSVNILQGKTYAQTGLGYTSPLDVSTGGIGANGALLANVIANWGTMYDISNITTCSDPYVFGQNLLNQKLGKYGLTTLFRDAGLNLTNLTQVEPSTSYTGQQPTSLSATSTVVGQYTLPSLQSSTTVTTVTASSPAVMHQIYSQITGANLASIISGTSFVAEQPNNIKTLDDLLTFSKVVDANTLTSLSKLGIKDFPSFGTYIQKIFKTGYFASWKDLATFLNNIEVPTLVASSASEPTANVLLSSTISTLMPASATGTGSLGQATIADFLGATAGIPYTVLLKEIVTAYSSLNTSSLISALNALKSAVNTYISQVTYNSETQTYTYGSITPVNTAAAAVTAALNQFPNSSAYQTANVAYTTMINHLGSEVSNLTKSNIKFLPSPTVSLNSFAQNFVNNATDKLQTQSYQFFANITTLDSYGDILRSAIAEAINMQTLQSVGIQTTNDPQPALALQQADRQGIPITTYLSQNK